MILTADPKRVVEVTFGGRTFRAGQVTYANLLATQTALDHKYPGSQIVVIQPCYNTGVAASAGTHDRDGVLDVEITGIGWGPAQSFLRTQGWAAWWRHTGTWAARDRWHIHMISLAAWKASCPLGQYVDGGISEFGHVVTSSQITDYYNHALGLAGQHDSGDDRTWHPADIDRTIFRYAHWRDNDMPYRNWPEADKKALVNDVAEAVTEHVLDADMNANEPKGTPAFQGVSLRELLKNVARAVKAT